MIRRLLTTLAVAVAAFAATAPSAFAQAAAGTASGARDFLSIGAGLGLGIAAAGGAVGQGRAVASALDGIARNPSASGKIQTPMIIGLALIESLVIYALVIAFLLQAKI